MRRHQLGLTAACLLGGYLVSCGSTPVDVNEREREAIATKSGLYCEYVRQTGKTEELQLELNTQVARRCGHGRVPSLTQYIVGEVRGIMFCCNKENEPRAVAPAPASSPSATPSPAPAPRPSVVPRLPVKKPSPSPLPKPKRGLPPAQKPMITPKAAATPAPAATQPPAQTPAQAPTPRRPDQDPAVLPSAAP